MKKPWLSALVALLMLAGIAGLAAVTRPRPAASTWAAESATEADGGGAAFEEGGDPDAEASSHVGTVRIRNRVLAPTALAATGWAGEVQVANEDTWEPYVAADPSSGYVYVMYNRFGTSSCKRCPSPEVKIRISSDGGQTWAPEKPMCTCTGVAWQYDPVMAVSSSGAVYATWMNANTIVFSKSTDHGATWSTPLGVSGNSWADKPWIGVSASGTDVYIAYESRSELQLTSSHNGGSTFSAPIKVNSDTSVYRYPNGFAVLPNGTAVLAASKYPGGSTKTSGPVDIDVWRSTNGGASWSRVVVDNVFTGVNFETSSTTTIAGDTAGRLVIEYSGALSLGGNTRIFTRTSTDGGLTWSARQEVGSATANGSFPAIAAKAAGDFRLTYMDNSSGAWNVWYRASTDGGATWSAALRVSDATSGTSYKTANGFTSYYGDYDGIAITNAGKSVVVSGQGASFSSGPGSIWFNRQI